MGTTSYPGGLDDFAGTSPSGQNVDDSTGRTHSERHNDIEAAMEAVQAELGTDPAGGAATVKSRLENLSHFTQMSWRSGEWLSSSRVNLNTTTTVSAAADTVYFIPLWVPLSATLDRIAIRVGTGQASANCRIGIYAADGTSGKPTGAATDLGEVDASVSSTLTTLTISQSVSGGQVLWVALHNETASVALGEAGAAVQRVWNGSEDGTNISRPTTHYTHTATYSSGLPTVGTLTAGYGAVPLVAARRT